MWRRQVGQVPAVQDVTLSIAPAEAFGLVGESGSGKSTLARLLVGLLKPTTGSIQIAGEPSRRTIQMVFQDPTMSLNPRMSVEEILGEPLIIHRLASTKIAQRQRIEQLLQAVQLPPTYRARLPRQLSGGERQRVGIARALATDPQLLICDEPIASLDVSIGAQILQLLAALRRQRGMALLFISHDLGAVASLCDRVAVMREGRLLEVAPTAQLLHQPADPYTRLLLASAALQLD
jgi:ABC-type dipeptide/oligopeptide/nickel transport system ATPase subunit